MTAPKRVASELDRLPRTLSLAIHELRTPLAVASGYLRMLLREQAGAVAAPQRRMLEETAKACARIGSLIAEMSELQRIEAGDLVIPDSPFDISALVVELGSSVTEGEDRGVRLEVRASEAVAVIGDRVRLAVVLRALMHSALQEREEPGVIVTECSTLSTANKMWAVVTIGDEASTRSLLEAAHDVRPYFDEWREGLGFALPVGRRVIEAHGGALWSVPAGAPRTGSALRLPLAM